MRHRQEGDRKDSINERHRQEGDRKDPINDRHRKEDDRKDSINERHRQGYFYPTSGHTEYKQPVDFKSSHCRGIQPRQKKKLDFMQMRSYAVGTW